MLPSKVRQPEVRQYASTCLDPSTYNRKVPGQTSQSVRKEVGKHDVTSRFFITWSMNMLESVR